jgi:hypothetical protein
VFVVRGWSLELSGQISNFQVFSCGQFPLATDHLILEELRSVMGLIADQLIWSTVTHVVVGTASTKYVIPFV